MLELLLFFIPSIFIYNFIRTPNRVELLGISLIISIIQFAHICILLESLDMCNHSFLLAFNGIIGVDPISLWLIWLTCLILPIVLLNSKTPSSLFLLLILTWLSILVFMILDLILFYITYELLLIPMFFILGLFGSRNRKIIALYQLFMYTIFGSLLLLIAFLILILEAGSSSWFNLLLLDISPAKQLPLAIAIFIGFSVKVPLIPFHLWLPEAHVEAPTNLSVFLAAILLKVGIYGMIRFLIPLFPTALSSLQPLIFLIGLLGILYTSIVCLSLWDLKKFVAYSSISHMNLAILGIFSNNISGLLSSYFFLISHGIISGALFLLIGFSYERFHTRIFLYFRGLVLLLPLFILFFFIFSLANMAFPLTSAFIAEFLSFFSLLHISPILSFIASFAIFLTPLYVLWFLHQLSYAKFSKFLLPFSDLTLKEFHLILPLLFFLLLLGLNPSFLFSSLTTSLYSLLY